MLRMMHRQDRARRRSDDAFGNATHEQVAHPTLRWSLAETLCASGYEVTEAHDGASAIRTMASADVVLLDLHLPDSRDLRVLASIRRLSPKVPVIVMTAFRTLEVLKRGTRLGAFAVIDKPFDMSDISPLVGRALVAPAP